MRNRFQQFFSFSLPGNSGNFQLLNDDGNSVSRINTILQYTAFFMLLFAAKLWLLKSYGYATPVWDQWDAEARYLYSPYLQGKLKFSYLFEPHNEHRILTTRLFGLILLEMNKIWNPLLEMLVGGLIYMFAIILCICLINRVTGRNNLSGSLAFALILFSLPWGFENALTSFQVSFYFVLLFSISAIWLLINAEAFSFRWFAGIVCGIISFLSLGSGIFAFGAVAAISSLMYFLNLRKTKKQLFSAITLILIFLIGIKLTPTIPQHDVLKAHSIGALYTSLVTVMGWPIESNLISALVRNLPIFLFAGIMLWKRPPANDPKWLLMTVIVWSVLQTLSISYGRATQPVIGRYRDFHAIVILVNFGCLLSLGQTYFNSKWRNYIVAGTGGWIGLVIISASLFTMHHVPRELELKHEIDVPQEINTRNYVLTGDIAHLKDKPQNFIPFFSYELLASAIEMPGVREILPTNISKPIQPVSCDIQPAGSFINDGFYETTPKRTYTTTWGSYSYSGNPALGTAVLHFNNTNLKGRKIEIPVAGYPLKDGIKLEIEQNGKRQVLQMEENPGERWGAAYARIMDGNFSIHVTDSTTSYWVAVGQPIILGRLDGITTRTISNYHIFLLVGITLVLFLITWNSWIKRKV